MPFGGAPTAPEEAGVGLVDRVPLAVAVAVPVPVAEAPGDAAGVGASPDRDPVAVAVPVAELDGTIYTVPVAVLLGYAVEPDALATAEGLCTCVCDPECDWVGRRLCVLVAVPVPVAVPVAVIDIEGRGGYAVVDGATDGCTDVRIGWDARSAGEGEADFEHTRVWHVSEPLAGAVEFMQYAYAAAHEGVDRSTLQETPPMVPVPGFCDDTGVATKRM